ncbi:MAG: RNA polymerase sigma factor [Janthinobacterium lividum]
MATMMVSPAMLRLTVAPGQGRSVTRDAADDDESIRQRIVPPTAAAELTAGSFSAVPTRPEAGGSNPGGRPVVETSEADALRAKAIAEQARLAELAASCLRGDTAAWELLVRSQQRRVYGICYRFTGSTTEAEDLTQDAFLKVYRHLASFDPAKASFGVWLTALTRNLLVDHYRRSRMERASESLDVPFAGEEEGPTRAERLADDRSGQERHVAGLELRAQVQAALAKISPELREAVIMRDLQDLDYREIAEVLCIPQGTVKSRISRGRAELARLLKGMEGQVM